MVGVAVTTASTPLYLAAQPAHLAQLTIMLPALLSGTWTLQSLQEMQQANHQLRVMETAQQVIGFAEFLLVADECQIFNIAISAASQRQGCGKQLLRAVLTEAAHKGMKEAVLEVRESNLSARSLYEQAGFVRTGRRPRYYPPLPGSTDMEAALLYSCSLSG